MKTVTQHPPGGRATGANASSGTPVTTETTSRAAAARPAPVRSRKYGPRQSAEWLTRILRCILLVAGTGIARPCPARGST
jgi:hypothetical protein